MNQMSDDLISRKAAYKAFSDYFNRNFIGEISSQTELSIGEIASVIKSIPTVFDKEKVIDQLKVLSAGIILNTNISDDYAEGYVKAAKDMIAIVEKGGIE